LGDSGDKVYAAGFGDSTIDKIGLMSANNQIIQAIAVNITCTRDW
jgi:hypothetical protein